MSRLITLKFDSEKFAHDEMEELMEELGRALPNDVNAIALPEDVEMLGPNDIGLLINRLEGMLEDD